MLALCMSLVGILLTIILVVGVHECGHFIVARILGIKVLCFSIGFGKKIFSLTGKGGTEYKFALFPLGGYVKMLDENEGPVHPEDVRFAYNRQPIYKKLAIILAGPLFNFLFAVVLYWLVFVVGFISPIPLIGSITPHSIADQAGLKSEQEIIRINGKHTLSWPDVIMQLLDVFGADKTIQIVTFSQATDIQHIYELNTTHWKMDNLNPDPLASLGINPYIPEIKNIIHTILPDSPAAHANLQIHDVILAIQNHPVKEWEEVVNWINRNPGKVLTFKIKRAEEIIFLPVLIGTKYSILKKHGYLGIYPEIDNKKNILRKIEYRPWPALTHAIKNTFDFIYLNLSFLGKMLTGKVSLQSLGGPITIFGSAGTAFNAGFVIFLNFLAFLSIALGVINLIPIPGLDGGHALIHILEAIRRRPFSQRWLELFFRLGFIFLIVLLIQALVNDVIRLA